MASDFGEDEIKIEYYETFQDDPLCDKPESPVTSSQDTGVLIEPCRRKPSDDMLEESIPDRLYDSLDDERATETYEVSDIHNDDKTNWYKSFDKSGRYLCRFCELTYSTIQTLRYHVRSKHPDIAKRLKNIISNNKRNRKLKCHICKKRFKLIKDLKTHVKQIHDTNLSEENYCNNCNANFKDRTQLCDHLLENHKILGNTFFHCTICQYRTVKKSHFSQHVSTHLEEKDKNCKYCDYSTNYLPNLKVHERIHTNEKPYSCSYTGCEYSCSAKSALRSHQLKHNREGNMLYCDKCSYTTVYKQSLNKHIDSHRRDRIKIKL